MPGPKTRNFRKLDPKIQWIHSFCISQAMKDTQTEQKPVEAVHPRKRLCVGSRPLRIASLQQFDHDFRLKRAFTSKKRIEIREWLVTEWWKFMISGLQVRIYCKIHDAYEKSEFLSTTIKKMPVGSVWLLLWSQKTPLTGLHSNAKIFQKLFAAAQGPVQICPMWTRNIVWTCLCLSKNLSRCVCNTMRCRVWLKYVDVCFLGFLSVP